MWFNFPTVCLDEWYWYHLLKVKSAPMESKNNRRQKATSSKCLNVDLVPLERLLQYQKMSNIFARYGAKAIRGAMEQDMPNIDGRCMKNYALLISFAEKVTYSKYVNFLTIFIDIFNIKN